ncbi:NAD(P)/FAD-dependent oxidoreductase [Rhodoferax sp.]|uniref:NAD(P)/FAD-dependent oxidoreductase n=1 Tax=Rhodoferax sp. TaxID=50421 RepID=UPI0025FC974B|nr:NAD(P)/FAD-dependent oxidoreductase [Rhodoferax sp.]
MERVDCVVVGAGVVGLAVARRLALAGRDVLVLEACEAFGTETSARNSEVIHAGIYYPPNSLKAKLCVQGKQQLYAYLEERHLPFTRCGKLIVATRIEQMASLLHLREQANANGVHDLTLLSAEQVAAMEPELRCVGALWSPSTGILDSHALMVSLLGDMEARGGVLALNSPLAQAEYAQGAIYLVANDGTQLHAKTVVNAAGLHACDVARKCAGMRAEAIPVARYAKGSYFTLAGRSPFSHLVYPMPEAAGLGVHLTLDLGGRARFGPDVEWVAHAADLAVDPARGDAFYDAIRRYWPALPDGALQPAYAGMRPKISGPTEPAADFVIQTAAEHGVRGWINLFGIESPGLTSALAIADHVALLAEENL